MKNNGFSAALQRLWTRPDYGAFDLVHFTADDETGAEAPENWNDIARELFFDEGAFMAPVRLKAIEENTVPSWLWRHGTASKATESENKVQEIFHRAVGSATYKAWQEDFFRDEVQARCFYDELCYGLAQRFIALEPHLLAQVGTEWAYEVKAPINRTATGIAENLALELSNEAIDDIVGGHRQAKTRKLFTQPASHLTITFSDIAEDWGNMGNDVICNAAIDLMRFRHNDGSVNIEALRHAVQLLVIFLDLQDQPVRIGTINLASLLMALALPYDSDNARHFAGALMALISAEAFATSALLAAQRGTSTDFAEKRKGVMRNLRNHRRAAYGERNDYEKLSVLPVALDVKKSPDLTLLAAAQRFWDEAIEETRQHGLRHTQVTASSFSPSLRAFMESNACGIEPLARLTDLQTRQLSPAAAEALARLGYEERTIQSIEQHAAGYKDLAAAPTINHASLKQRGLNAEAIAAVEDYLHNVNDIRLAFTVWVIGKEYGRTKLKIPTRQIENPAFDLLNYLGFSEEDIAAANAYCYGADSLENCKDLRSTHRAVFAIKDELSPTAQIRMAASAQSFISSAVQPDIGLDVATSMEKKEKILLEAWRNGLRIVQIRMHTAEETQIPARIHKSKRRLSAFIHTNPVPSLPLGRMKTKARSNLADIEKQTASGHHRRKQGKTSSLKPTSRG